MTSVTLRPRRRASGPPDPANPRRDACLIGFQDQGNLGMGYLAAHLHAHGYTVDLIEFRDDRASIVERVLASEPLVVGFSLIFQYFMLDYERLARDLREAGCNAHFTIGGHYPSLCHDEVLTAMPQLDSVTRFEGELTLLDLVTCLARGDDWRSVDGLAYLDDDGQVVESAPRALVHDLDELPLPVRTSATPAVLGWKAMPLLASRGCARRCSFCSIHTFYRSAPGKTVRVRRPERVVAEMKQLIEEFGVTVFLFQDDDFPLWGRAGKVWVLELVDELHRQGLVGRCIWKISCRADYVEPELFATLRDAGLYLVYMGLESGSEEGLATLNKKITAETNLRAVRILKDLGLLYEYGFMLFDPSSTFESVRVNVRFLREFLGDGSGGAVFCRMMPYGGTPIRDQLRAEGRLKGDVRHPDYDFLDLRLNRYHALLDDAVAAWIHGHGLSHQLNWAWHEVFIVERLVGHLPGIADYSRALAALTQRSNEALFSIVEETSLAYEQGQRHPMLSKDQTQPICDAIHTQLLDLRNEAIALHEDVLMEALAKRQITGPVTAPQIF